MKRKTKIAAITSGIVLLIAAGVFVYDIQFKKNRAGCKGQQYMFDYASGSGECRDLKTGCGADEETGFKTPDGRFGTCFHGTMFSDKNSS